MRAFVTASGYTIPVVAGEASSWNNANTTTTVCVNNLLSLPITSYDLEVLRIAQKEKGLVFNGPLFSRMDVDDLFGYASALRQLASARSGSLQPPAMAGMATAALEAALLSAPVRLNYIALGPLTNLATFLKNSRSSSKPKLSVHVGAGIGMATESLYADVAAASYVFDYPSIYRRMYATSLLQSIEITPPQWSVFSSKTSSQSDSRAWLADMLAAAHYSARFDLLSSAQQQAAKDIFFQSIPDSSFVVLSVITDSVKTALPEAITRLVQVNASGIDFIVPGGSHSTVHYGTDVIAMNDGMDSSQWTSRYWEAIYFLLD